MFTTNDIRDIAIQIERNGEKTYRWASRNTRDAELSRLLEWMADEELRHVRWFEALTVEADALGEDNQIETMGRSLLQEMVQNQTFSLQEDQLLSARDLNDLFSQALEFEQDTILFYEMLQSFIDNDDTLAQLNSIIAEERAHVAQLGHLKKTFQTEGG